jgi:hypothetical protein
MYIVAIDRHLLFFVFSTLSTTYMSYYNRRKYKSNVIMTFPSSAISTLLQTCVQTSRARDTRGPCTVLARCSETAYLNRDALGKLLFYLPDVQSLSFTCRMCRDSLLCTGCPKPLFLRTGCAEPLFYVPDVQNLSCTYRVCRDSLLSTGCADPLDRKAVIDRVAWARARETVHTCLK